MTAEVALRAPAALVPFVHPMRVEAEALGDAALKYAVGEVLREQDAIRRLWDQFLSESIPCTAADDDLYVDEDCGWVSPMAGANLPAVDMDWSKLDWSRGGRA